MSAAPITISAGHEVMEGLEDEDRGMFVLFLVQYAVHKSLALKGKPFS